MRTCFVWISFFVSVASVYGSEALALQERLLEVYEQNKGAIVRVKAAYAGDEVDGKQQVMLRVGRGFLLAKRPRLGECESCGWS